MSANPTPPANSNERICAASGKVEKYLVCTRALDHDGDHAAHGESDTEPMEVWSQ